MSVDKLVDSTQLNADLTAVANAIRTKGGTSAQLAFPAGFVSAIQAIETGNFVKVSGMTVASECNWFTAWEALEFKWHYEKSSLLVVNLGAVAASGGSNYTNNNKILSHDGTTVIAPRESRWYFQQKTAKVTPSSFAFRVDSSTCTWYYGAVATIGADGSLSAPVAQGSAVMIPAGSLLYVFEFPNSTKNGELDLAPFGG